MQSNYDLIRPGISGKQNIVLNLKKSIQIYE